MIGWQGSLSACPSSSFSTGGESHEAVGVDDLVPRAIRPGNRHLVPLPHFPDEIGFFFAADETRAVMNQQGTRRFVIYLHMAKDVCLRIEAGDEAYLVLDTLEWPLRHGDIVLVWSLDMGCAFREGHIVAVGLLGMCLPVAMYGLG